MFPDITLNGTYPLVGAALVGLVLVVIWIAQFANLMALDDEVFPGQFVRFGWVAAFVTLWFLAPFAFILWVRWSRRQARRTRTRGRRDD